MRWTSFLLALLTSVLLAGCGLLGKAKNLGTAKGKPNFELVIRAQPEAAQDLLQAHLELNRYRHLEGLRRQELTRLVSVADADIRKLLGTLGYFAPTVELVLEAPPRDSEVLPTVRITVDAGVQTTVAQADIQVTSPQEGEKAGSWQRQSIGRNWPLEVGQPFSQAAWASAKAEGLRSLQARRYPTAALTTSRAEIDADTHQAHLQAHYATGPLVRFGALTIEGGERYDNAGVARAARLPVGAEYRQTTLLDVQQRMAATGLYDSVFLTLQTDNIPPDATEVQVPVLAQVMLEVPSFTATITKTSPPAVLLLASLSPVELVVAVSVTLPVRGAVKDTLHTMEAPAFKLTCGEEGVQVTEAPAGSPDTSQDAFVAVVDPTLVQVTVPLTAPP